MDTLTEAMDAQITFLVDGKAVTPVGTCPTMISTATAWPITQTPSSSWTM